MTVSGDTDQDEVLFEDEPQHRTKHTRGEDWERTEARLAALAAGRAARAKQVAVAAEKRANGEVTRYQQYKQGLLKIEDMDDDEVRKAKWKDLAGTFQGPPQRFSGPDALAIQRELLKRGQRLLQENFQDALKVLVEVAINPSPLTKDGDRIKAAQMIIERVAGKVPDKVEVGGADAFSDLLQDVIDDGVLKGDGDVVQGMVVDER